MIKMAGMSSGSTVTVPSSSGLVGQNIMENVSPSLASSSATSSPAPGSSLYRQNPVSASGANSGSAVTAPAGAHNSPKSPRGSRSPAIHRPDTSGTLRLNITLGKNPSIIPIHSGPFYLIKEPPAKESITGSTNLMAHYGLEHSYTKFCGKKLKEELSAFLPHLPGNIDTPGHEDNSSLRSVIDKPPICGKEVLPLSNATMVGFRLHPGPLPEQYRMLSHSVHKKKKKKKDKQKDRSGGEQPGETAPSTPAAPNPVPSPAVMPPGTPSPAPQQPQVLPVPPNLPPGAGGVQGQPGPIPGLTPPAAPILTTDGALPGANSLVPNSDVSADVYEAKKHKKQKRHDEEKEKRKKKKEKKKKKDKHHSPDHYMDTG